MTVDNPPASIHRGCMKIVVALLVLFFFFVRVVSRFIIVSTHVVLFALPLVATHGALCSLQNPPGILFVRVSVTFLSFYEIAATGNMNISVFGVERRVVLPSSLVAEFEKIAKYNTDRPPYGIETCGILAGRLVSFESDSLNAQYDTAGCTSLCGVDRRYFLEACLGWNNVCQYKRPHTRHRFLFVCARHCCSDVLLFL